MCVCANMPNVKQHLPFRRLFKLQKWLNIIIQSTMSSSFPLIIKRSMRPNFSLGEKCNPPCYKSCSFPFVCGLWGSFPSLREMLLTTLNFRFGFFLKTFSNRTAMHQRGGKQCHLLDLEFLCTKYFTTFVQIFYQSWQTAIYKYLEPPITSCTDNTKMLHMSKWSFLWPK